MENELARENTITDAGFEDLPAVKLRAGGYEMAFVELEGHDRDERCVACVLFVD